jgi:hypothetical protein
VAPTGTAGTIRLDEIRVTSQDAVDASTVNGARAWGTDKEAIVRASELSGVTDEEFNYESADAIKNIWGRGSRTRQFEPGKPPPRVFLRPTDVSDAWFILNLLSNVPFLSSLSYSNTMEVLEIAQVEMFRANEIVIPGERRSEVLCVVWEGACVERGSLESSEFGNVEADILDRQISPAELDLERVVYCDQEEETPHRHNPTVWHAGDWTGPVALQPDIERSAELFDGGGLKDIVALSSDGVKVILLNMKDLHQILKSGSKLFRKYLTLKEKQAAEEEAMKAQIIRTEDLTFQSPNVNGFYQMETVVEHQTPNNWYAYDSVLEVLKCNSALGKLTALQKRHLESLAEGPRFFECGNYLWQVGQPVEFAFLIVAGTAAFAPKPEDDLWRNRRGSTGNMSAEEQQDQPQHQPQPGDDPRRLETLPFIEEDKQLFNVPPNSEYARLEIGLQLRVEEMELDVYDQSRDLLPKEERMRNTRDRFANKVLARLYSRRAYTSGLVFSRGHLLSDTSRMVSGNLAHIHHTGRQESMGSIAHGLSGDHHCHTSNMVAGPDGCVVMVFPRSSLVQFLDGNPGVLLSLLGTQVVV